MSELLAKETIEVRGLQLAAVLEAINVRQACAARSEKKAHEAASGSALMLTTINNQISLSSHERMAIWRFGAEDAMYSPPVHLWIEDIQHAMSKTPVPFKQVSISIGEKSFSSKKGEVVTPRGRVLVLADVAFLHVFRTGDQKEKYVQVPQNKPLERWLRRQCRFEGKRLKA